MFRHGDELVPSASEGGHTEFGPRSEGERDLLRFLLARHGHVSCERIVSGPGLGVAAGSRFIIADGASEARGPV